MNKLCDLKETQISVASDHLATPPRTWLRVSDVMSKDAATMSPDETMVSAAKIMSEKKISCLVIMDNGNLTGILTETDMLQRIDGNGRELYELKLSQVMSSPVESVPSDLSVLQASQIMSDKHIKRLPILKEQKLVGIVTQTDLVRALTSYGMWTDISKIMSRDVAGIQSNASVAEAAKVMTSRKISCIVVLDGDEVAGILTEKDLLGRVVALKRDPAYVKMEEVMSSPVTSIPPSFSVFSASKIMEQMNIRRLVVMQDNHLSGVITQTDILAAIRNKLQVEEEKNFRILEESKSNIYTTDLDGMITYVNPAFMELLEVSNSEELVGQPFLPEPFWFNVEDRKQFLSELKEANHQNKELSLKTSKGKKIYVTIFSRFTKDIHGEINGSQGIVYDITAKKQLVALRETEEALHQSEERLQSILNSILTGVVIIDAESHKIVDANPLVFELIGLSKEKVVGKICHKFICPAEQGRCPISDLGQTVDKSECVLLKANGKKIPILKTVTCTTWQGRAYFVESFIDITDRRQAEEQIKAIIQCTGDAVRVVDKDFNVIRVNSEMEKFAGSFADVRKCYEHFHSDLCNTDKCTLKQILSGEQRIQYEVHKTTSDGKSIPCELIATPLKIEDHVVGMIESFRDITERKRAEAELKKAQKKLVETAHREGMAEVATNVLHNVGNVLNNINISTALITEKVSKSEITNLKKLAGIINEHIDDLETFLTEDPRGKHIPVYLNEISNLLTDEQADIIIKIRALSENVQHIKDIVSMQQSYAKVSGLEMSTSLAELIEDAIQINGAGLQRHGSQLRREFEDLPNVEIEKQKVLQILVNLINNAKYTLSDSDKEEKILNVRLHKHGEDHIRIEVADNGIGISKENLTKIFSHGFTTKKHGHGFGLHSSDLAAKEIGGSLTVRSDGIGQGATFILELPFKPVKVMP